MAVYVDNARIPYGRMLMSHMFADTRDELIQMARVIGLDTKHLQHAGEPNEHFDVSATYRQKAIAAGAQEIDSRGLVKIIRARRRDMAVYLATDGDDFPVPDDAPEPAPIEGDFEPDEPDPEEDPYEDYDPADPVDWDEEG